MPIAVDRSVWRNSRAFWESDRSSPSSFDTLKSQERFSRRAIEAIAVTVWMAVTFVGMLTLPIVGEEPRRGEVAREMARTGDYLIPREQGRVYCTRPPLQNWIIAAVAHVTGSFDAFAVRLPSVVATFVTALVCYLFAKHYVGWAQGIAAGTAYLTMGQVLTIGQLGETDPLFALFVGSSLLAFYAGWATPQRRMILWAAAGCLAGLGALTKGLQAPMYFFACSALFLILVRKRDLLVSRDYLVAVAAFWMPVLAWTGPYYLAAGWDATKEIWFGQVEQRLAFDGLLLHGAKYPIEIFVAMLPWSLLLLAYLTRSWDHQSGDERWLIRYLGLCLGIGFLSLWVIPAARVRYFLPMFPLAAILAVIPLCSTLNVPRVSKPGSRARGLSVELFWITLRVVMVVGPLTLVALAVLVQLSDSPPWLRVVDHRVWEIAVVVCLGLSGLFMYGRWQKHPTPETFGLTVLMAGAFLGMGHRLAVLPVQENLLRSPAEEIASLAQELSEAERLVSLGPIPAAFRFHYPFFIEQLPLETNLAEQGPRVFCLAGTQYHRSQPQVPSGSTQPRQIFPWDGWTVACPAPAFSWRVRQVVPLGRTRTRDPQPVVIVGEVVTAEAGSRTDSPAEGTLTSQPRRSIQAP